MTDYTGMNDRSRKIPNIFSISSDSSFIASSVTSGLNVSLGFFLIE